MITRYLPFLMLLACAGAAAQTDAPADPDAKVEVSAVRNPELHKYRSLIAGLDEFDAQRARYAPQVPELRFRLWPTRSASADPLKGLSLKLASDSESIPLPLDAEASFVLPRLARPYQENADLILNRRKNEFSGFPYVRTPGLPAHVRRLGDHRLECRVAVAIGKKEMGLLATLTANTMMLATDWCGSKKAVWKLDAAYELESAVLREGSRSRELPVEGRLYEVPMSDTTWSNDAVIELHPRAAAKAEAQESP